MISLALAHVHAGLVRERVRRWLRDLTANKPLEPLPAEGAVSLYLHVPFCPNLCRFCHFVRYPFKEELAARYYKKLVEDVREAHARGYEVKEVYIGGGSPSVMPEMLGELVDVLWELWKAPISLEVSPRDVANKRATDYIDPKKVKRVSMGAQSFSEEGLRRLGRPVGLKDTLEAIDIVKSRNYECFNVDVVWGAEWLREGLETAFECGADQLTFYPLMPFPLKGPMGEVEGFKMYEEIVRMARSRGFERLNAWTFCKDTGLVDEYIVDTNEFLGLGVSSFSLLGGVAHLNTFSLDKYFEKGWFPVEHSLAMDKGELAQFRLAYKVHSDPGSLGLKGELGWYLGVVTLREVYTVLGEFRVRRMRGIMRF